MQNSSPQQSPVHQARSSEPRFSQEAKVPPQALPATTPSFHIEAYHSSKMREVMVEQEREVVTHDKYLNNAIPLEDRDIKVNTIQRFLTEFDSNEGSQKVREEGVEQAWDGINSTQQKTSNWTTIYKGSVESVKEIKKVETDETQFRDPGAKSGQREGVNKNGIAWFEDWQSNEQTGYKRWNTYQVEAKRLRDDGRDRKWGEWREEKPGEATQGETWEEFYNETDDYWERRSEKYTEHPKPIVSKIDDGAFDIILRAPTMKRSGISEFKNNRHYSKVEQWEEYADGTLLKKTIMDDGYGKKTMVEQGLKLNGSKMQLKVITDHEGYFQKFEDCEGRLFSDLKSLVEENKQYLAWEYTNTTVEDIGKAKITYTRIGTDFINGDRWENTKKYFKNDHSEEVVNKATDATGEWLETWKKRNLERWAKKEGKRGSHVWKEQWYKKVKKLSRKKDVATGVELDGEDSDGS